MKIIEKEGKSTSAIIADFMKETGLKLNDFKFEVTEEGSAGFLNLFGAKPTKLKFILADIEDTIKKSTERFLNNLKADYSNIEISKKNGVFQIHIIGAVDPGFLIGKEARLLNSFQYLLNQMINKKEKKQIKINLDIDGYRKRKKTALADKVKSITEKVKSKGRSITLEPLNAENRKVVHKIVEKDELVRTMTIGEGDAKRVVILPASQKNEKPQKNAKPAKKYSNNRRR
jgi:spoIIIJ-associated protein